MRLNDLTKKELCELCAALIQRGGEHNKYIISNFLITRWSEKYNEVLEKMDEHINDAEWYKYQQQSQKLDEKLEYYMTLDLDSEVSVQ